MSIEYNKELFDFVNDLTAISPSIAFERDGDRVVVRKSDKNKTLPYIISAPAEYFDIEDTVAFYNYNNFYKFLTQLKEPKLSVEGDWLLMQGRFKIEYLLSDEEGIINGPKKVNFDHGDVRFTLTKEDLAQLVSLNSMVKGDKAHIKCVDNQVTITFYKNGSDNRLEAPFECERITDYDDDFEFVILSNRFDYLPSKRDYVIDISHEKFIRMSLIHEDIEFNLYTGDAS